MTSWTFLFLVFVFKYTLKGTALAYLYLKKKKEELMKMELSAAQLPTFQPQLGTTAVDVSLRGQNQLAEAEQASQ